MWGDCVLTVLCNHPYLVFLIFAVFAIPTSYYIVSPCYSCCNCHCTIET